MKTPLLSIQNLFVSINQKPILKGFCLDIFEGEIHAIMGPNGTGKSTLTKVLAGFPNYQIDAGTILFQGEPITDLPAENRATLGLFLGFQYPVEIAGVSNSTFLKQALSSHRKARKEPPLTDAEFHQLLQEKMTLVGMRSDLKDRNVNEGFSGGEKKRNEILQMALLNPKIAVLDETDSGLDIDALNAISNGINALMHMDSKKALLLITHYQRLLHYVTPHFVHVMLDGRLVKHGGPELALELEKTGYTFLQEAIS